MPQVFVSVEAQIPHRAHFDLSVALWCIVIACAASLMIAARGKKKMKPNISCKMFCPLDELHLKQIRSTQHVQCGSRKENK